MIAALWGHDYLGILYRCQNQEFLYHKRACLSSCRKGKLRTLGEKGTTSRLIFKKR